MKNPQSIFNLPQVSYSLTIPFIYLSSKWLSFQEIKVILFCFLHVLNIFLCASVGQHHVKVLFSQLCLTLCNPTNYTPPLSTEFARQEYWSGLPFYSPGDLPNSGIEPRSLALQADALLSEPPGKPYTNTTSLIPIEM